MIIKTLIIHNRDLIFHENTLENLIKHYISYATKTRNCEKIKLTRLYFVKCIFEFFIFFKLELTEVGCGKCSSDNS